MASQFGCMVNQSGALLTQALQRHQRFGTHWKTKSPCEKEVNENVFEKAGTMYFFPFKCFVIKVQCVWFLDIQRTLTVQSSRDWAFKKKVCFFSSIISYFLQSVWDTFKSHSCSSNAGSPTGCPRHSVDESKSNRKMKSTAMLWWGLKLINNARYHKRKTPF